MAFDVKIRDRQVMIGATPNWSHERVQRLLDDALLPAAKQKQPWWEKIPDRDTARRRRSTVPTLHEAASEYLRAKEAVLGKRSSFEAVRSPVIKHVLPFFAYEDAAREHPRLWTEIDGPLVTEFVAAKKREREAMLDLVDTLAELGDAILRDPDALAEQLDAEEWRLLRTYGQVSPRGKHSLSSRGLGPNEVNRCLDRLNDILRMASNGAPFQDPTKGRRPQKKEPPREWLRPLQFQAVLDAAAELDAGTVIDRASHTSIRNGVEVPVNGFSQKSRYGNIGRYEALIVLGLAGPRVSEFGGARWMHYHDGVLWIPEAKTTAGERNVHLHRMARDVLDARKERLAPTQGDYIFATEAGTRRDRNNVRNRILGPVLLRAAKLLDERGHRPLPDRVTPHTFRRTYLTYLAWAGKPERFAMQQAGHEDAKLTLEVYQQALPHDPAGLAMVEAWLAD